jgi:23S rRNA (uracil1939-C5)-methyltransferase
VGPSDGFGYRNHAVFKIDSKGRTAYHRAGSRELEPIDACPLLHPLLREWHEALPPLPAAEGLELRVGTRTGQRLAMVRGKLSPQAQAAAQANGVTLTRAGSDDLAEMVGTERFRVSSKAFFQVNTEGAETLTELVLEMLEPDAESVVLDLFAGVGLFALPLSRRAARVFAVESNPAAIRDLRHHAKGRPIHIIGTDVQRATEQLPGKVHHVVADPPREGLGEPVARILASLRASRIVLVSCDPAAGARDAKALVSGGYCLARVVPVDLFPHTYHVETVSLFERE